MKNIARIGLICLSVITLIWSCEKIRTYPNVPKINFKSLSLRKVYDTTIGDTVNLQTEAVLTFHLIDGDGDVGLHEYDTVLHPDPNLYLFILKKTDTGFVDINPLFPWTYRTPFVETQGQDKSLVADVEVTRDFSPGSLPKNQIIKIRYYIYDRSLNKSNVDETPEFNSDTLGVIK